MTGLRGPFFVISGAWLVASLSSCGTQCTDCGPEILFDVPVITESALTNGILWVPSTNGAWEINGTELEVIEQTPNRQILRVPVELEPGAYTMRSTDESREVRIADPAQVAPFESVHDSARPLAAGLRVSGSCTSSCESIPRFELPRPPVEPSDNQKYLGLSFQVSVPESGARFATVVDVWEAGVEVDDPAAPRVVDSAAPILSNDLGFVHGRSSASGFQVRFRSLLDPSLVGQVFQVDAE